MTYQYGFIGAGNMAKAIISGAINKGIAANHIIASTKTIESSTAISNEIGIHTTQHNHDCLSADTIILAVKPQILVEVLQQLDTQILSQKRIISVIAGIPCQTYYQHISPDIRLIRTMPNMPAVIGEGMTGLYAENCSQADREIAEQLMQSVGKTLWVEQESGIDYVNAISGSGPAYFYRFIHHLAEAGQQLGLSYTDAITLSIQTAIGASQLCQQQSDGTPASMTSLIAQVTSKGGTTFEAMQSFDHDHLDQIVNNAVQQCYEKAIALGKAHHPLT